MSHLFMQAERLREELADAERSLQAIVEANMTGTPPHKIATDNVLRLAAELREVETKLKAFRERR